jgi:hypothetical protein
MGLMSKDRAIDLGLACLVVICFTLSAVGVGNNHKTNVRLQRQVTYFCTTNLVLDQLVVDAASLIENNLDNGTYDNLIHAGIADPQIKIQAMKTRDSYRLVHKKLAANRDCEK